MITAASPSAVTSRPALLAESPVWDARTQSLLWVDILRGEVHRLDPQRGDQVVASLEIPVGAVAPREGDGYVLAAGMGFWLSDGQRTTEICSVSDRGERMNDGKCDPAGRLWAGTMTADHEPGAALYCLDAELSVRPAVTSVRLSNGLGWSPDATTMYYVDTPTKRIDAFDFDLDSGAIANRRCFVDLGAEHGRPDGLTVDVDGGVWVAMINAWSVHRYTSDGALDGAIRFPAQRVTSCTFGGPDLMDLYVTTACQGLSDDELAAQPQAGLIFRARPGVQGLPANHFAG